MELQEQKSLVQIINDSGLEQSKAEIMLQKFNNYFEIAADWERKARAIVVTREDQIAEMKMAREGRLFLKQKRVDVENTRKTLKEQALREGQTIDSIARIIKNLIEPTENYLEQQEKFAEIQQENRKIARLHDRENELRSYEFEPANAFVNLKEMDDAAYSIFRDGVKKQYEDRKEAERKAEEERIAREKKAEEERLATIAENERLRKEAEEREKAMAAERARVEAERKAADEKAKKEREEAEKKLAEERRIAAEKLEKEQAESRRLAAELQAKKDADEAERKSKEQEDRDRIAAEKKAAAAPDKDKLIVAVQGLKWPELNLKTAWGDITEKMITEKFEAFKEWAVREISKAQNSLGL